jgi:hypothetical protein
MSQPRILKTFGNFQFKVFASRVKELFKIYLTALYLRLLFSARLSNFTRAGYPKIFLRFMKRVTILTKLSKRA